jgi:hypothetical protein
MYPSRVDPVSSSPISLTAHEERTRAVAAASAADASRRVRFTGILRVGDTGAGIDRHGRFRLAIA